MGNGNIEVGNQTPTRKPGSSERRIDSSPTIEPHCGAMTQQSHEFLGNLSAPQKFVRLVGCHEPKVVRDAEGRPYPNPAKR